MATASLTIPYMEDLLHRLLTYHHTSNGRYFDLIRTQDDACPEAVTRLCNHWVNAQHIWNARILGIEPGHPVWATHALPALRALDKDNERESRQIIRDYDMARDIIYVNSQGASHTNTIGDIFLHVINHATYHRGQAALLLRQAGVNPPVTDLAYMQREQAL